MYQMVKPVFRALQEIKASATADEAQNVATDFFRSAHAIKVDRAQAGTFIKEIEKAFEKLQAPDHYEHVLRAAIAVRARTSYDLQELSERALKDFGYRQQIAQELEPHLQTRAEIFTNIAATNAATFASTDFDFPQHYGSKEEESAPPAYPEFVRSRNPYEFLSALQMVLLEDDLTEAQAPVLFKAVLDAIEAFKISTKDQINIISMLQEKLSINSETYNAAIDKTEELIKKIEGSSPSSANHSGHDYTFK